MRPGVFLCLLLLTEAYAVLYDKNRKKPAKSLTVNQVHTLS